LNLKDGIAPAPALSEAFARLRERREATLGLSLSERLAALAALQALLRENSTALAAAVDRDFRGRARQETRLLEIFPALEAIGHARKHLRSWIAPRRDP
jgi:coniferyl-aldehyde dehydrogenase